jgi:hypothetical protein
MNCVYTNISTTFTKLACNVYSDFPNGDQPPMFYRPYLDLSTACTVGCVGLVVTALDLKLGEPGSSLGVAQETSA